MCQWKRTAVLVFLVVFSITCSKTNEINEVCTSDQDCHEKIKGKAFCKEGETQRTCQCENGYTAVKLEQVICLQVSSKENGFSCDYNEQCTGSELGTLSRCVKETGTCQCYDTNEENRQKGIVNSTMLHHERGYCFYKTDEDGYCKDHLECKLSSPGKRLACLNNICQDTSIAHPYSSVLVLFAGFLSFKLFKL